MATKVFISWSGDLSNKLADAVRQWLPGVLQFVKPYFTPSDIEKGTKWASGIAGELESSDIGIICLTKENLTKPWILFESGALSKNLENSRVCTLLFGIDSTDLKGPLTTFQTTRFEKSDFKKLVKTINNTGGDNKLEDNVLEQVFEMWWEKLENQISEILRNHQDSEETEHRSERDILEEILELSRLGARRRSSRLEMPPDVLMDLAESAMELQHVVEREGSKRAYMALRRMQKPLEYLMRRSDYPEVYERYRMMRNEMRHRVMPEEVDSGDES
ncbi:TIR domain-containing protein [Thiomicrorhabdus heinhorstiae]|uniref:Toll/interleukin-1 receptor domain-containing protein n=1 Tax=Thiomicrorhabdus heinhorstiae TaxID=2748010 RepID=A0ABS0C2S8_9GAMM|nr:TIR domain-containing protein [Thiomicrorhabdus heinhorstiae]MBF6058592.1 toll/interleukin-1 receptor domain-containing protein [Thiomicrorhabdus heinhorstiae]